MARDRKKKVVPSLDTAPKRIVNNPLVAKSTRGSVWFDFHSNQWLTSVKRKRFTNFLKDKDEFTKNHFAIFYTIIPKVIGEWNEILRGSGNYQYPHCHLLKGDKKEVARDIFKEIYNYELSDEINIWQFGFTGSIRIICIHNDVEKAFIPIFIDHHHLIYESVKYNDSDYGNYSYCAICNFIKNK